MRARVAVFVGVTVGALVACGLGVTGSLSDEAEVAPDGSGVDGGVGAGADGSTDDDGGGFPIDGGGATDGGGPEASAVACGAVCPAAGGACDAGTCVFSCQLAGDCDGGVSCPPGVPCDVTCDRGNSCGNGVDCGKASSCNVDCKQGNACGPITCTGGVAPGAGDAGIATCTIRCEQGMSCSGKINANAGDSGIRCDQGNACADDITCGGGACTIDCGAGTANCGGGTTCCATTCTPAGDQTPNCD